MKTLPKETPIRDLHVAAYLLASGYSVLRVEGTPSRAIFVFSAVPDEAVIAFYGETAKVNPRKILDSLRSLKGLILQHGEGMGGR